MEPIAIIGMSCRFPGAEDPQAFWELLKNSGDAITEVPPDRWNLDDFYDPTPGKSKKMNTRWGGFLTQVDQFDCNFFGIPHRRAVLIDPQHRLVLEVAWEALENAGIIPGDLAGSQTGVFIAISHSDYDRLICRDLAQINAHHGPSTYHCIAANRLSHTLDLRGPSLAIDTGCSSSLVALHLACQSLRTGESNLALVGGVSLILSPEETIASSQAGVMAPDGRCKTFDASANGYVRSEGCGVVAIKRLTDAISDGDNVLAVIKGSAVNQNGLGNGLTAYNGLAQQALISQALANAGVKPAEISYVEAHGTGTPMGDPIEFNALKTVLMQDRQPQQTCKIGSVKTNIGYLESAAGMAGLIKVVLMLQHRQIPAHLNFKTLNQRISLAETPLEIPTECQPWETDNQPLRAGVSAFGFGGTNSHGILEAAPQSIQVIYPLKERSLHIFTLSAKNMPALREMVERYLVYLQSHPEISLADLCFTVNTGRSDFNYRLGAIASSIPQLIEKLRGFLAETSNNGVLTGQISHRKPPQVGFLLGAQGSEYVGMARQLYGTSSYFRQILGECSAIIDPYLPIPLLEVIYPPSGQVSHLYQTPYSQLATFAIEYALAKLWQSWGIIPTALMGFGVGEYVAACIAGLLSLTDAIALLLADLKLTKLSENITYHSPSIPLVSSTTGSLYQEGSVSDLGISPAEPTGWLKGIEIMEAQGCTILVDVGVNPDLLSMGQYYPLAAIQLGLPSLYQGLADWQQLLESLRSLYLVGIPINWRNFDRDYPRQRLQLPTYPFQRQRCWLEAPESDKVTNLLKLAAVNRDSSQIAI
jgi:acyl transferase domain-containing protein